jgi:hypothetical protein
MSPGPLPGQLEMGNNSPISLDLTHADSNAPLKGSGHSSLAAQINDIFLSSRATINSSLV